MVFFIYMIHDEQQCILVYEYVSTVKIFPRKCHWMKTHWIGQFLKMMGQFLKMTAFPAIVATAKA